MSITQQGGTKQGGTRQGSTQQPATADPWVTAQRSPEFVQMRKKLRGFVFPMTAFFLSWYFLYVLLAAFAPDFMGTPVFGNVNVGLLFGLGQFVSTFAITMAYRSWANKKYDHSAEQLRARIEGGAA